MSVEQQRSPLWIWEDGGEAVSLAGIGRPSGSGERVGPVYTPPELREILTNEAVPGEAKARWLRENLLEPAG